MIGEIKLFLAQEVIFSINELFLKVGWFIWVILKLDDEVKGMKVGSPLGFEYRRLKTQLGFKNATVE